MKKIIIAVIILAIIAAGAWLILLRPSDYTRESLTSFFEQKKDSFITMADYLTENKVVATIDGLLSIDNGQKVPNVNESRYRAFNNANEVIMRECVTKVESHGSRVEFCFSDEGGLLNRVNARIAYEKDAPNDPSAIKLSIEDWYLYIE